MNNDFLKYDLKDYTGYESPTETPCVSVVVPVYNNQEYLLKCLYYLNKQTLENIEIIIVNDGSVDSAKEIAEQAALIDKRIKILSQEHKMAGAARNAGTKLALGEYIGYVDSDDWVDYDYFEKLYVAAKKYDADIAFATNVRIGNGKTKFRLNIKREEVYADIEAKLNACKAAENPCPTNKIYRRSFLIENNIIWPEGCYCEDKLFVTQAVYYANCLVSVPDIKYYYYRNPASSVKTKNKLIRKKFFEDKEKSRKDVLEFLKSKNVKLSENNFWAIKKKFSILGINWYIIKESLNTEKHLLFSIIPVWEGKKNG